MAACPFFGEYLQLFFDENPPQWHSDTLFDSFCTLDLDPVLNPDCYYQSQHWVTNIWDGHEMTWYDSTKPLCDTRDICPAINRIEIYEETYADNGPAACEEAKNFPECAFWGEWNEAFCMVVDACPISYVIMDGGEGSINDVVCDEIVNDDTCKSTWEEYAGEVIEACYAYLTAIGNAPQ
mmetsp:Transcript_45522/g.142568  ORF Transcript_45522/g.142568 Transcript_45522/m.142568 type:complete len:180 (-) Transcript_45522:326-865(-)